MGRRTTREDGYRKRYRDATKTTALGGVDKFVAGLKASEAAKDFLKGERAYTLHKTARRNYPRRKVIVKKHGIQFQADLVDLTYLSKQNKGHKYILNIIDVFSRYAYAFAQKTKNGPETAKNFEKFLLDHPNTIESLQTDRDRCFLSRPFQAVLKKHNIKLFHSFTELKASIVERFNQTLLNRLARYRTATGSQKWLAVLPVLVNTYNNTRHSALGMAPAKVSDRNYEHVFNKIHEAKSVPQMQKKYKVGDHVRISRLKHIFAKGYAPRWTEQIYQIHKVLQGNPTVYKLIDWQKEPIEGVFYKEELQIVKPRDLFAIDKVLKRNKDRYYVSWIGYPKEYNSWVHKNDLYHIRDG